MLSRLKQYVLLGAVIYGFYFLLSHHFIVTGFDLESFMDVRVLKKKELTLKYTFFSLKQATPEKVMQIPELREAGLGGIMIEKGISPRRSSPRIERKIDMQ